MTVGRLIHLLRSKYSHGLITAYYRDIVRSAILQTPPVLDTESSVCEIHILTSFDDWLNVLWALKSFYHFSKREYGLCIHDDGSVDDYGRETLIKHFPRCRFISRKSADQEVLASLKDYPRCSGLRQTNTLSLKLFDFRHYLQSTRLLLLDSDVLFFAEPLELLQLIDDPTFRYNAVNEDVDSAYTVDPVDVKALLGIDLRPRFNSGLGLIHRQSLDLQWIEACLALPGIDAHFWRIEQTLFALCSSRFGTQLLPRPYRVHLGKGINGAPCRHYVGQIRHLMYREGIAALVRARFLAQGAIQSCAQQPR